MTRHAPEEILAQHSQGNLTLAESVLVELHLTSCPTCRRTLEAFEHLAADRLLLDEEAPPPFESLLDLLDEPVPAPTEPLHHDLPRPLAHLPMGPWRWLAPWTKGRQIAVDTTGGRLPLTFIEMSAGARLYHVDGGTERAVVLQGGWSDQDGHVGVGDLVWSEPHAGVHEQVIDRGESCIAVVLNDAKATPSGPFRALGRWFKV